MRCWFSWSSWVAHVQLVTGRCIAAVQKKSWIIVLWLVPGRAMHPTSQLVIYKKIFLAIGSVLAPRGRRGDREDAEVAIPQQRGMSLQLFLKAFSILLLSWLEPTAFYPRADFYQLMISQFNSISCATYEWTRIGLLFLAYCLQYGFWFDEYNIWRWWIKANSHISGEQGTLLFCYLTYQRTPVCRYSEYLHNL